MERDEFERLRHATKHIRGDIVLVRRRGSGRYVGSVAVESEGAAPRMILHAAYVPDRGDLITFNVVVDEVGPVCRLDIRGANHRGAGRTHKHALRNAMCPASNPPHAIGQPRFADLTLEEGFRHFCEMASIRPHGSIALHEEAE